MQMRKLVRGLVQCGLAMSIAGGLTLAHASKSDNTVNIDVGMPLVNAGDMYFSPTTDTMMLAYVTTDGLLYSDPNTGELKPALAKAWRQVNDTTLEFDLRDDIVFHDGSKFDADDVVYTFAYIKKTTFPANSRYSWIASAEKVSQYKVRVHTTKPYAAAAASLMNIAIWPNGVMEQYSDPKEFGKHLIGTGPYKLESFEAGKNLVLRRNDNYKLTNTKHMPKVERINIREVKDRQTQLAELMAGQVDFIFDVNKDQAENLKGMPGIKIATGDSTRFIYLAFDAAGRSGADNPMTKLEVRQALAYAIDRQAIAKAMDPGGAAAVINSFCVVPQIGCTDDVKTYNYDPAKAKAMLAKAGYANGFELKVSTYGGYKGFAESLMGYLQAVGVKASVNYVTIAAYRKMRSAGELQAAVGQWSNGGESDVAMTLAYFLQGGGNDYSGDKTMNQMAIDSAGIMDSAKRKTALNQVMQRIADNAYILPLFRLTPIYASNDKLNFNAKHRTGVPALDTLEWK